MEDEKNMQDSLAEEVKARKAKNQARIGNVLAHLPKETITYSQAPTPTIDISYTLTAKDYTEFYLEDKRLPDLTPEEQLILLTTQFTEPIRTQGEMLSGIYKAREAKQRAGKKGDAFSFMYKYLRKANRNLGAFERRVEAHCDNAKQLQKYLDASNEQNQYLMNQGNKLFDFKNKIKQFFTKKQYTKPPYTQAEIDKGTKAWQKFRKAQNASPETPNDVLLNLYKYGTDCPMLNSNRYTNCCSI